MGYSKKTNAYVNKQEETKQEETKQVTFSPELQTKQVTFSPELQTKQVTFSPELQTKTMLEELDEEIEIPSVVSVPSSSGMFVESYENDNEFRAFVNSMNEARSNTMVSNMSISLVDLIDNLNKRMMYLEFKSDISYEKDNNKYMNYDKALMEMKK